MKAMVTFTAENIILGAPMEFDLTKNIAEILLGKLKKRPKDSVVMVDSHTGAKLTTECLIQDSATLAQWLKSEKIAPGDCVGMCAENRQEFIASQLAILAIGATCAPLNPIYTAGELKHVLGISRPRLIFCSLAVAEKISSVLVELSLDCKLVSFDDIPQNQTKIELYKNVIKNQANLSNWRATEINLKENVAAVFCSSGTTGLPKCVQLTQANLACAFQVVEDPLITGVVDDRDILLGLPPFFHGYGFLVLLAAMNKGSKVVAISKYSEQHFLETVQNYKITVMYIVPPIAVFLAKNPLVEKYDLSSLRMVRCGAAPLSADVQLAAKKRLNDVDFSQVYGLTELSVASSYNPWQASKLGSVGVIINGSDCKVNSLETGKPLAAFQHGELCFRGPYVMKGYMNDKKATDEMIDDQGWLHTGDIGYYDQQGFLFIVSRLKELIKYNGYQVAPAELEAVLLTHPGIKDAGVIGIPDEKAGELPLAFIVRQPNSKVTGQDITDFVSEKVSPQKRLSGGVRFVSEIPKNPSGKIIRRELKAQFQS